MATTKKMLTRKFVLVSRFGRDSYAFFREMKRDFRTGEIHPFIIINIKSSDGSGTLRKFISYDEMNQPMRVSVMTNFKQWCKRYIELSGEYDPDTDKIIEI